MAKKKSVRYICPCCYGSIDLSQIHYSCTNPECTKAFLETCSASELRRYGSRYKPDEEIDVEKSEYLGLDPRSPEAVTTREHIIRGSLNGSCDVCKSKNTIKLCPKCHTPITAGAEENGTTIFVIMGTEGCGKSHYLASLIKSIEEIYPGEFRIPFTAASEKTVLKFDKEYRSRVFLEGKCLPPTPSYDITDTRDPLLYELGGENHAIHRTVAFLDTSGADLDLGNKLSFLNVSTYISGASGIMFLVDPMQLPKVRERLGLPTVEGQFPDMADTLNYISEIIRDKNKLRTKDDIEIPLAVVLTKVDLLMRSANGAEDEDALFGPESSLHIERERETTDTVNINQVGAEVEEYLRRNAGQEFLDEVNKYTTHQYFAVSALGSDTAEGKLIKGVEPYRVEDPVIWFLNSNERRRWF